MGPQALIVNDFFEPASRAAREKVAAQFEAAEPGTCAVIHVSEMSYSIRWYGKEADIAKFREISSELNM